MPTKQTVRKAKRDLAAGKRASTVAGEFVREELEHVRRGRHGARSPRQAIAIGLSKARRAGVPLRPPGPGGATARTRRSAARDYETGQGRRRPRAPSRRRARAVERALGREPRDTAEARSLAQQSRRAARRRTRSDRSRAAKAAARTKGPRARSAAAKRAAATRRRQRRLSSIKNRGSRR
jgi:hypothetical protein